MYIYVCYIYTGAHTEPFSSYQALTACLCHVADEAAALCYDDGPLLLAVFTASPVPVHSLITHSPNVLDSRYSRHDRPKL